MHHAVVLGFIMVYIAGYRVHKLVGTHWKAYGYQSCGQKKVIFTSTVVLYVHSIQQN